MLSAVAWSVCTGERRTEYDDPTFIRHLRNLVGLEQVVINSDALAGAVQSVMAVEVTKRLVNPLRGRKRSSPKASFVARL